MTKKIIKTITEYKDPSDLFTQDEQKKQCCELVSCDPCVEVGRVDVYDSADKDDLDLDALLASARAAHPDMNIVDVQVIDKGPTGPCGEMHTRWEGKLNCCDGVEPLEIDKDRSVEVMNDFSGGIIFLKNPAERQITVSVRGSGFFASNDGRSKSAVYDAGNGGFIIETGDACGSCTVTVSDGCSSTSHNVASVNGKWGPMVGEWGTGREVAIEGLEGTLYEYISGLSRWMGQSARYKQYETWGSVLSGSSSGCDTEVLPPICGSAVKCPLGAIGTYVGWQCYRLDSVFSNRKYHIVDSGGCTVGIVRCECNCISGHSYEEWIC